MSQKRLSMRKVKEVLRLRFELGLDHRQIAGSCRVSRVTVGEYLSRFAAAGLSWPLPGGHRRRRVDAPSPRDHQSPDDPFAAAARPVGGASGVAPQGRDMQGL